MGEPAGIGPEITVLAWQQRRNGLPPFFAIGDPDVFAAAARAVGGACPIRVIDDPAAARDGGDALPVLAEPLSAPTVPGQPRPENAGSVTGAIERAVQLALDGRIAAVVTNPIQKKTLYDAGFAYPGHTEFLAHLTGAATPVMMLVVPGLRVVPVTVHLSLRDAVAALTAETIVAAGRITADALRGDFGIARPRLAVAGLNPHAGEQGEMGDEEAAVIEPAIATLRHDGIDVTGPLPPDTMFHAAARRGYDAALCMYHDQALIPLKTIDFDHGVNVTLGLPIVRTSPDHGTALDKAGTGTASPDSLIAALQLAAEIAAHRGA